MTLIPNWSWNKHFTHRVPVNANIFELLQFYYCTWILLLFNFFLLLICVKLNVSNGKTKRKRILSWKVVIFISNMNVFDIIFDSSKKSSRETKKRRLSESRRWLRWWLLTPTRSPLIIRFLFLINLMVRIICALFHLFFFLINISTDTLAHCFSVGTFCLLSLIFIMPFRPSHFVNYPMH